jgi:D-alanine-D-alanine ligase
MIKVLLLTGGISSEREISIQTGRTIYENLSKDDYDVIVVEILHNKNWYLKKEDKILDIDAFFRTEKIDVAFIAMHGKYGEDGTVQAILDHYDIPYVGSGVLASAIAMDKYRTKLLFKGIGLLLHLI